MSKSPFVLEHILDAGIYLFFEKVMRGGVSYISNRYSIADNKYLKSNNPKQVSNHVIYLDANNIYGYAMSEYLPTDGFKQILPKEFGLNKYNNNISIGYILEVHFGYPEELPELHNDYFLIKKIFA